MDSTADGNVNDQQCASGLVEHHDDFLQRGQFDGNDDEQESNGAEIPRFSGFADDRSSSGAQSYV